MRLHGDERPHAHTFPCIAALGLGLLLVSPAHMPELFGRQCAELIQRQADATERRAKDVQDVYRLFFSSSPPSPSPDAAVPESPPAMAALQADRSEGTRESENS